MWSAGPKGLRLTIRASLAVGACLTLLGALVPAALAGGVTVSLTALSPIRQPQGLAFDFRIQVDNADGVSRTVTVVERLAPVSNPASFVEFVWDKGTVPGGGTKVFAEDVSTPQYYSQTGSFEITPYIDGAQAGAPLQFEVTPPTVVPVTFEDVTAAAGVGATLPDTQCDGQQIAGAAWEDVDSDGDLDLYLPLPDQDAKLFINDGAGRFTDRAEQFGVKNSGSVGRAAVFADYDNDGDQDLYVLNDGPNRLYRNQGGTSFVDVAAAAGMADPAVGTSGSWGDYDNDGRLDLYVTNYADCSETPQDDKLYHNEGNGTFSDQTALLEHGPGCADGCTRGYGFQAAWFDYDRDRDLDLYLANDLNPTMPNPDSNHLWRNDGPGGQGGWLFTDVTVQANAAPPDLQSMGLAIGDPDGDLDLDVVVSDIYGNVALRNNGDRTFTEAADQMNIDRPWEHAGVRSITWGLAFSDFNLDGWEDLYVASGAILNEGSQDPRKNEMFVNLGTRVFADLSALSGADSSLKSRGVAFADYDRDGKLDMYVVNQAGSPVLYHNTTATGGRHWIEIDPVGTTSNRDGCGALVMVQMGGRRLIRQVFCGSVSLGSGNDPYVHFGLNTAARVDKIVILWPSGKRQVRLNVAADQYFRVVEPTG